MDLRFPLKDVTLETASRKREVTDPLYSDGLYSLNSREFSMDVKGVAWFYVCDGSLVSVVPCEGADSNTLELYLNGSVYGAVLHQRMILPLHGSSFDIGGNGVMLCGEAGAGKSSLTASFCLGGAVFLTDDVTPLLFREGRSYILPLSDRIKLWADSLGQLEKQQEGLSRIEPETDKYYYPMPAAQGDGFALSIIYVIEVNSDHGLTISELTGSDKFEALRNEIYRPEYLRGMPGNERVYFNNLLTLAAGTAVFRVNRPSGMGIDEMTGLLRDHLERSIAW